MSTAVKAEVPDEFDEAKVQDLKQAIAGVSRGELFLIPLDQVRESPLNPRKHYEPKALEELKESLLATGQLTPVIARPLKNGKGYELAAGHRRYRAAKLAGFTELLAVVRPLDDRTFLEILTIENLQRDDLHPLEEAQGFADLMKHAGYDVAKIAARIGRSENYVYDRVKLLQLIPAAKKLFSEGVMEAGHAILLARLTPEQQKQTVGDVKELEEGYGSHDGLFREQRGHYEENESLPLKDRIKAVSVRELQRYIDDTFRAAPDRIDPVLFPDTAAVLADAKDMHTKIVHITRDHRTSDATRDEKVKTYGREAWKRADGLEDPSDEERGHSMRSGAKPVKPATCPHWVIGLVVSGPGREEAFKVCVAKEKCHVHWPEQAKAAERRKKAVKKDAKEGGTKNQEKEADRAKQLAERQAAEVKALQERDARWKKAAPALITALVASIEKMPVKAKADVLLKRFQAEQWNKLAKKLQDTVPAGTAVLTKLIAYMLLEEISEYQFEQEIHGAFAEVGVKPKELEAIVDKAAPPIAEKSPDVRKPGKKPKAKVKK